MKKVDNESEKPVLRGAIRELKARHKISGRTIQVADKGLNCAENILQAKKGWGWLYLYEIGQDAA